MALAAESIYRSHVSASSELARVNAVTEMVSGLLVTYLPPLVAALQNDKELTSLLERLDRKLDIILRDDKEVEEKRGKYDGEAPFLEKEDDLQKRKYMGNVPFAAAEKDTAKRFDYDGNRPFVNGESQKDEKKRYYDGNAPYVYENERTLDGGKSYDHEDENLTESEKQKEEKVLRQLLDILVRKRDHDIPFPLVGYKRDHQ